MISASPSPSRFAPCSARPLSPLTLADPLIPLTLAALRRPSPPRAAPIAHGVT